MEEASQINWNQLAAQSGVLIGFGSILARLLWGKIKSEIKADVEQSETKILSKLSKDKEKIYTDINGLGKKCQDLELQLALQQQVDERHDKELAEARTNHRDLDERFNKMVEKIFIKIEEVKDLIITKYIKD